MQAALTGDNNTIEQACGKLGTDVTALANLHAKITYEIITALTLSDEQKATLQEMQTKIGSHVGAMIEAKFTHLEKWIAKHGGSSPSE